MKRVALVLICILLLLSGCGCDHEWNPATCTAAKQCVLCGKTEGTALEHAWMDATCVAAKTCQLCGETEGAALGHEWVDATCVTAKTCQLCTQTEGSALGHRFEKYTCDGTNFNSNCTLCGEEQTLDPETYTRQILTGTWEARFYFNDPYSEEYPGHTITFYDDGTGTLDLDSRLWYPATVQLRPEEFAYRDKLGTYSMDFYLDSYMLDEFDAAEYDLLTQNGWGISFRLHIPTDSSRTDEPYLCLSYTGYSAIWEFEKQ